MAADSDTCVSHETVVMATFSITEKSIGEDGGGRDLV
jgi:hypothetical protein